MDVGRQAARGPSLRRVAVPNGEVCLRSPQSTLNADCHQGWAWADVAEVIDRVMVTMERLHPTAAEFATFAEASKPASFGQVAAQRQRELDRDTNAVDAALRLWPPLYVPLCLGLPPPQRAC